MLTHKSSYAFSQLTDDGNVTIAQADKINTVTLKNTGTADVVIAGLMTLKNGEAITLGGREWCIIVQTFAITFGATGTKILDVIKETFTAIS